MALTRRARKICALSAAALVIALTIDAYRLLQAQRLNQAIATGKPLPAQTNLPPQALFAQARALEGSDDQAALTLYKRIQLEGDAALRIAARYNSANIYLTQALAQTEDDQRQLMLPLAEMAKEGYRATLRADPSHWDAKYNLERALRLVPEEDDLAQEEPDTIKDAERAVTTMRGVSLGLP